MMLKFLRFHHSRLAKRGTKTYDLYECVCGNQKVIRRDQVKAGNIKSCGCFRRHMARENLKKIRRLNYNNVNNGGRKPGTSVPSANKGKVCIYLTKDKHIGSRRMYVTEEELTEIYLGIRDDPAA